MQKQGHTDAGGASVFERGHRLRPAFKNPQELLSNKELLPHIKRGLAGDLVQGNQYQIDSADGPWKPWAARSRWRWVPRRGGALDHKAMTHETHVSVSLTLQELCIAIDAGASSGRGADSEDVFERLADVSIGSNAA